MRFILDRPIACNAASQILLGIRPESISDKPLGLAESSQPVSAMLKRLEFRGGETYGHLLRERCTFIARLGTSARTLERPLEVYFDLAQAHFFDRETGVRIA
jgi:hypothetical protein